MASVNKVIIDFGRLRQLYVDELRSIPQVSKDLGVTQSTIRARLKECGLLRSRADAVRLARDQGRLGSGTRGKQRHFTAEWCARISESKRRAGDQAAAGVSAKKGGYVQITRGPNKGRGLHVVIKETEIGRRLLPSEVVHHDDENKHNNDPSNLVLMTRSAHARHHRNQEQQRKNHG